MSKKLWIFLVLLIFVSGVTSPALGQQEAAAAPQRLDIHWLALAMAVAAAGCGYAQSRALTAGCEGVSRNPGSSDTIRFFIILGLAFIEFLALLTFVVVFLLLPA